MDLEIHTMPGHLIRRLNQISVSVFHEQMKRHAIDCTSVQFAALYAIRSNPKLDQATLAGIIAYDRATIGNVIDRLEKKGLVNRSINKKDRRAKEILLTDEGVSALDAMIPIVKNLQNDILGGLTESERTEFIRLAAKLATTSNKLSRAPLILQSRLDGASNP